MKITIHDIEQKRLLRIAALMDGEARTWLDGFAAYDGHQYTWRKENDWAQIRFIKLTNGAAFIRDIAGRKPSDVKA